MANVCTPLQCFRLGFLALNLLIIDSSLNMHADYCRKKNMQFLFQFFNLIEKLQAELENHTFHKGLFGGFFESSSNIRMVPTYCCPGFVLVVLVHS